MLIALVYIEIEIQKLSLLGTPVLQILAPLGIPDL